MKVNIRLIYLYLVSFVGLLLVIIGTMRIVDLGLKTYVFHIEEYRTYPARIPVSEDSTITEEDMNMQQEEMREIERENQKQEQKRDIAGALAMILVGVPVYAYHWKTIQKEQK